MKLQSMAVLTRDDVEKLLRDGGWIYGSLLQFASDEEYAPSLARDGIRRGLFEVVTQRDFPEAWLGISDWESVEFEVEHLAAGPDYEHYWSVTVTWEETGEVE